jgi:hypothetical protein
MGIGIGDWPTWIAAVATVGALIFAGIAAWASWQVLKRETLRDEARAEAERRSQANLVAAWPGVVPLHPDHPDQPAGAYGPVVRNASDLPVYRVFIWAMHSDRIRHVSRAYQIDVLPPGQWFVHHEDGRFHPHRPAVLSDVYKDQSDRQGIYAGVEFRDIYAKVEFRDAAGSEWRRDEYGDLRQTGVAAFAGVAAAAVIAADAEVIPAEEPTPDAPPEPTDNPA